MSDKNHLLLLPASAPLVGPTPGHRVIHLLFRCLRDVLLRTELLVPLMCLFFADICHTSFFVLKDIENFALHHGPLDFVARKRSVQFLLLRGLRSACTEAGLGEQGFSVVCFHTGAASKENDADGA